MVGSRGAFGGLDSGHAAAIGASSRWSVVGSRDVFDCFVIARSLELGALTVAVGM